MRLGSFQRSFQLLPVPFLLWWAKGRQKHPHSQTLTDPSWAPWSALGAGTLKQTCKAQSMPWRPTLHTGG